MNKQIIKHISLLANTIISAIYIVLLLISFDHDYRYDRWYDIMDFRTLHTVFCLAIIYLVFLYLRTNYKKISFVHMLILLIVSFLVSNAYQDLHPSYNYTTLYYYYSYIVLLGVHLIVFGISAYFMIKRLKKN